MLRVWLSIQVICQFKWLYLNVLLLSQQIASLLYLIFGLQQLMLCCWPYWSVSQLLCPRYPDTMTMSQSKDMFSSSINLPEPQMPYGTKFYTTGHSVNLSFYSFSAPCGWLKEQSFLAWFGTKQSTTPRAMVNCLEKYLVLRVSLCGNLQNYFTILIVFEDKNLRLNQT